ncbi:hypothetical protein ABMA28_014258 [Loxostege sticticalis]|uniref:F-box domain-containing protein n=1 Tax=Loxostege sticticalis TaxID=481309 RepID=A0ABD0TG67_LOXSC
MEEAEIEYTSIHSLPYEILTLILQHNDCHDIVSFGATCKRFRQMVENDQILWKDKFKSIIPTVMFDSVDKHCDGKWLNSIKAFFNLKKLIYSEILAMSPKFYWKCPEITLEDVRNFFTIALSNSLNYYYIIFILQDLIRKGNAHIDKNCSEKPYTMTEIYYAKEVLRYLIQTFLAVKWVTAHMRNELPPEIVVNFFLQWTDTVNLHPDLEIENSINDLASKVKLVLNAQNPKLASKSILDCTNKLVSERQVLHAVTQVIYHQRHMAVITAANLDTLNIIKVLKTKCSNIIVIGAIYQAVARRCGVHCEMIAFPPNHLFLEWVDRSDAASPVSYTVDLNTGELKPKRRCPFSLTQNSNYKYCPDSLLQYIYSSFHSTMGAIKNWNTQNAVYLLDFLGTSHYFSYSYRNPYRNFLTYLIDHTHLSAMSIPPNLTYLNDEHKQIIRVLANLNAPVTNFVTKDFVVKKHAGNVKFAVGMICYHTKFDYVGIVRAWDLSCDAKWADRMEMELSLEFGVDQPFYYLVAADQSARYVAQENLIEITHPTRLYHLEDAIAREFTHFDGFSYMLNDEKRAEYPDDESIAALYRNRSHYRP